MGWMKKVFGKTSVRAASSDVVRYFDAVRAHYLDILRRGAHDASRSDGQVLVEAVVDVRAEDGAESATPDELDLPYRYDIVCVSPNGQVQPTMPVGDHSIAWTPATVAFGNRFAVRVEHVVWNVCVVAASPAPPKQSWTHLRTWFVKWFHAESTDDAPFSGCVHFMSTPELSENGDMIEVQVDLGSAPSAALVELLTLLGQLGCRDGLVHTPEGALENP